MHPGRTPKVNGNSRGLPGEKGRHLRSVDKSRRTPRLPERPPKGNREACNQTKEEAIETQAREYKRTTRQSKEDTQPELSVQPYFVIATPDPRASVQPGNLQRPSRHPQRNPRRSLQDTIHPAKAHGQDPSGRYPTRFVDALQTDKTQREHVEEKHASTFLEIKALINSKTAW